jgi:hypothetical protein
MLPYATPAITAITAQLDIWEERERDTLRSPARLWVPESRP